MRKDVVTMVLLTALAARCLVFSGAGAQTIAVGSKDFTEQVIMGHMVADLLEAHGFATNRILGLGGDDLVFTGMHRGEIDIWMSYSGTIYSVLLGNELVLGADPDELYRESQRQLLERHNLVLLEPIGFNNTYVFVADRSLVEKHGLTKVSDLIPIADTLTLGGSILFMGDRQDGIRGVEAVYGMKFRRTRAIESGLLFQAMQLGQVDLIVAFSTHGQIAALDLVMLEDDRQLFPPYHAGLIVRAQVLEQYPELREILGKLEGAIDDVTMARLNYEVDGHRRNPRDVAQEFLREAGLI